MEGRGKKKTRSSINVLLKFQAAVEFQQITGGKYEIIQVLRCTCVSLGR